MVVPGIWRLSTRLFFLDMRNDYDLRQRKIYTDYTGYSTDSLIAILKSKKLITAVLDVIEDILIERHAIDQKSMQEYLSQKENAMDKNVNERMGVNISEERNKRQIEVDSFIKKFEKKPDRSLADIVLKYPGYQLASVEAALTISERRGIITSIEKDKLIAQIENRVFNKTREEKVKGREIINKSSGRIRFGLILLVLGIMLTVWSFTNPVNHYSYIFYGLIVSGAILIIRGLLS
jgi:hypothetical protein